MENSKIINGYLRADGRKGIRNVVLVAYLVECAKHVSQEIVYHFKNNEVQLIGFGGCYPNDYAAKMMEKLCTHVNVGAVLLVSLGCESFNRKKLQEKILQSDRQVSTIVIQQEGGTSCSIEKGIEWVYQSLAVLKDTPRTILSERDLIIGTICGGSDATSGMTANPAVGRMFDKLVANGGTAIFEETGEMIGLENVLVERAKNPELGKVLKRSVEKAARYYTIMGHGSFAQGNAEGGLSTIEEKSMGAYCKSGNSKIIGLIKPGDIPIQNGLFLLDVVPDGDPLFGFPNINDSSEIAELIACGSHIILFTTGRGSVVGSAISPVIKICANPDTFEKMSSDMDINAGEIITGQNTLDGVANNIYQKVIEVASGAKSCSEKLRHQEFVLTYKTFEPIGPSCIAS